MLHTIVPLILASRPTTILFDGLSVVRRMKVARSCSHRWYILCLQILLRLLREWLSRKRISLWHCVHVISSLRMFRHNYMRLLLQLR